jgi:hypothetical protein
MTTHNAGRFQDGSDFLASPPASDMESDEERDNTYDNTAFVRSMKNGDPIDSVGTAQPNSIVVQATTYGMDMLCDQPGGIAAAMM